MKIANYWKLHCTSSHCFIVFLILLGCVLPVNAGDYYVDDNGDNAYDGLTPSTPWRTITYAFNQLRYTGPHVIHIAEGYYNMALGEKFPLTMIPSYGTTGFSIQGAGRDKTILDSTGFNDRVIFLDQVENLSITGITIMGSLLYSGAGALRITNSRNVRIADNIIRDNEAGGGAGIYMQGPGLENITIENNIFRDNEATSGTADGASIFLYNTGETPLIKNNQFYNNISAGGAAGIYVLAGGGPSNATIEDNIFMFNRAQWGVAVYCFYSAPLVRNNYIAHNTAYALSSTHTAAGAGILMKNSTATITDNVVEFNHSEGLGGGLSTSNHSVPTVTNNIIRGNSADTLGGGIFALNSGGTYKNNLIIGNTADYQNEFTTAVGGGGMSIYRTAAPYVLINNTFAKNTASRDRNISGFQTLGSALFMNEASVTLQNNIFTGCKNGITVAEMPMPTVPNTITFISNNWFDNEDDNFYHAATAASYNLISDIETLIPGSSGNTVVDPEFIHGPGGSYYLSHTAAGNPTDSPLINAGTGTAVDVGLSTGWTTRIDHRDDAGIVDVGYHYSTFSSPPLPRIVPVIYPQACLLLLTLFFTYVITGFVYSHSR